MSPREVLQKYWGYADFREKQLEIIESILDGHDALGLLPTGGGKSITFQVPALMLDGITIVVTPLISLMKDQVDNLRARRISAYCLHSGMTRSESQLAMDKARLGKAKMLYVSPERLQSDNFIMEMRRWDLSMIVVDEAHCISQWGYDFRPSYLNISKLRDLFPAAPVLALTASATPAVADDIERQLQFRPGHQRFVKSFNRDNLSYVVRIDEYKERTLMRVLGNTTGTAIVYVRNRRRCRELSEKLEAQGISASYYHAGLESHEKAERQNAWKEDRVRVMVATNAFGMGIDKPDVRVVVHFDLPSSLEEYYQEAGRAGRDGKPSYAVVISNPVDKGTLTRRIAESFPPRDFIAKVYEMAGNFLEVAVGGGYQQIFTFNFKQFCHNFSLPALQTHSALQILSRAQYIDYEDDVHSRARVMILANKSEFYNLNLDPVTDRVFSALQREYTGLFSDYAYIEESLLAHRADVSDTQAHEALLLLSRMRVISYIPKSDLPYIYYCTSREEPRYLVIPTTVYDDRKRSMEDRIGWMKRFVFDHDRCRSQLLLEYFGEKATQPCGCCDVCRAKRQRPMDKSQQRSASDTVLYMASRPAGCTVDEILSTLSCPRAEGIQLLRQLADDRKILIDSTTMLVTVSQ